MLEKIKTAPAPDRFTQDFVNTKLAMKGGSARACIPFLKKMGFVGSDGSPTDLYREFRNPAKSRVAVGKAFKKLYSRLYEMNEYIHDASDQDVLGAIVECTGGEHDSSVTKLTLTTFNMLRKHADFDYQDQDSYIVDDGEGDANNKVAAFDFNRFNQENSTPSQGKSINLSYTINLNLPATKDIEVFNAIFKSLKEHILEE